MCCDISLFHTILRALFKHLKMTFMYKNNQHLLTSAFATERFLSFFRSAFLLKHMSKQLR